MNDKGQANSGDLRSAVRDHYASRATGDIAECGCCGPERLSRPAGLVGPILGCGNPLDRANLKPGEDVLDLGSGAGREVIEAAFRIAPGGVAYGLVMREMMRVLRPGGRLALSDTVADRPVPEEAKNDEELWCACISGAPQPEEYRQLLVEAGFVDVDVDVAGWDDGDKEGRGFRVGSAFISGRKA